MSKAAKSEQLDSLDKVIDLYPELLPDYEAAAKDGTVTKGEMLAIVKKAGELKKLKEAE